MKTESLRERIAAVREKLEPIRFRYLRVLRVVIFYWLFMSSCQASNLRSDDVLEGNPIFYHGMNAVSLLVGFILLCGLFVLYDPTARRRFCKQKPEKKGIFSESLFVLGSYEFLLEAAGLALLPLLFDTEAYVSPLYLIFRHSDFGGAGRYFLYLLTVFPIFLLIELFMRVRTRSYWRTLTYEEAKDKHFDGVALTFLCAVVVLGYPFIVRFYIGALTLALAFVIRFAPWVLLGIAAIVLVCSVLMYLRAFRIRHKFFRRLRKSCRLHDIAFPRIERPYRSLFTQKRADYQFTLELHGKRYACKLIGAMAKDMPMIFCDQESGYFKYGFQFRQKDIVFWRSWFTHSFEATGADRKILIILPAPRKMKAIHMQHLFSAGKVSFISEGKAERTLDNASEVYGASVFSGSGFLNAIERDCLDRSEKF